MDYSSYAFIIGALILAFALYMLVRDKIYGTTVENFEHPGRGPVEVMTSSYSPPKTVASSGPNPPSQEAPPGEVVMHAGPAPRDPLAEDEEESNAAPKMTYPERSFRPAVANDQVGLAYEAGIAGPTAQNSPQNLQKFGLDTVQNSGEFYNGVYANDTTSDMNFSAF
jgi:hypothetical protein